MDWRPPGPKSSYTKLPSYGIIDILDNKKGNKNMNDMNKIAALIQTLDNDQLTQIVNVVKSHRTVLAQATKLNLTVGMKVSWGAMGHGTVDKINRTKCICTRNDGQKWTIPMTMLRIS